MKRMVKASVVDENFEDFCRTVYDNMEKKYGFGVLRVYKNNKGNIRVEINVSDCDLDKAEEIGKDIQIIAEDAKLYKTPNYD